MTNTEADVERAWEPHERNYSGGRFGVWHDGQFTMLRVEAGVADATASIREHEAWDLALRLSPALGERLDYLFKQMKAAQAALHQFTWADTLSPLLRKIADDWECDADCERAGSSTCHERDEGCRFVEADELRQFATALETAAALQSRPSDASKPEAPVDGEVEVTDAMIAAGVGALGPFDGVTGPEAVKIYRAMHRAALQQEKK